MRAYLCFFLLGRMAILNGAAFLVPLLFAFSWGEPAYAYFGPSFLLTMALGGLLIWLGRNHSRHMGIASGAWYIFLVWIMLGCIGMLPYIFSGILSGSDAFFESIAAYTTVGLSCTRSLSVILPPSLVLWHGLMEWLGGLNFILLMVTIIPQVSGCFGLTLSVHQSISFSPMLGRMDNDARQVGKIYMAITVLSIAAYMLAGLPVFDACVSAFRSISTSGDMTFSFMAYDNPAVEAACAFSMLLACGNFLLYWKSFERRDIRSALHDTEIRVFLGLLIGTSLLISFHLWKMNVYEGAESLRLGFFHALSFYSTSGFIVADVSSWPDFDRFVLFLSVFVGGCIGSATGGLRVMRFIVLFKIASQEMRHLLHPRMVISLKVSGVSVHMKIISRVLSYFFLFMAVFFISTVIISLSGMTPLQSMGIAAGCLTSAGSTAYLFGAVEFSAEPVWLKTYCAFLMILGRLEIFSFLIVLQTAAQGLKRHW